MIFPHGPSKLLDKRKLDIEKCIIYINSSIEKSEGPKLSFYLNNCPYKEIKVSLIEMYLLAGWSKDCFILEYTQ